MITEYSLFARNAFYLSWGLDASLVEMDKKEEEAQAEDRRLVESVKYESEQEIEPLAKAIGGGMGLVTGIVALAAPVVPATIGALPVIGIIGVAMTVGVAAGRVLNPIVFSNLIRIGAEDKVKIQERRYSRLRQKQYQLERLRNHPTTDGSQLVQAQAYFEATIIKYENKVKVSTS